MARCKRQAGQEFQHLEIGHAKRETAYDSDIVCQLGAEVAIGLSACVLACEPDVPLDCLDECTNVAA